ncbi:DoxX family protein [Halospeciosus flavus]|uniref:DoxX family protein n=1 Tax=Halospeciosus flavus TaxID=3032283 RepID=A0ABD5Z1J6_9EURY|nr:DoxX family protein [Halospeciosus flavus]
MHSTRSVDGPLAPHVDYVTEGGGPSLDALHFLWDVVSEPLNAALLGGGAFAVLVVVLGYLRFRPFQRDFEALRDALSEYEQYLPWMLRLAIGLPLIGAGFAGYFFAPNIPAPTKVFQVLVGFLLLFGLGTRVVAFVGLLGYLVGLVVEPYLLIASEFVGGFLGIMLLGSGRPSADHLLQRVADAPGTSYGRIDPLHSLVSRFNRAIDPYEPYAATVVRVGLGFNFAYLGVVEKLLQPGRALQVVEKYDLTQVVPVDPGMWVIGAGLTELAIGVFLLLGLFTRGVSAVAFIVLTTTLFGLPDDPVLAHVSLFGLASMLFVTGSGPLALDNRLRSLAARVGLVPGSTAQAGQ